MPVLRFPTTVATPEFVAPMNAIREVPASIAKKLLAMRQNDFRNGEDGVSSPVVEVVSDPRRMAKAKPLHICKNDEPAWTAEDDS